MKKLLFSFILFLPLSIEAQEFILRNGEVYKFNRQQKKWETSPLSRGDILHYGDFLKAYTPFTVEKNGTWLDGFLSIFVNKKRFFTYNSDTIGFHFNIKLKEKIDINEPIDTRVVKLDADSIIEHLSWVLANADSASSMNVNFELYDSVTWVSLKDSTITKNHPAKLVIINNEPFDIYSYILSKDTVWSKFFKRPNVGCYKIKSYSQFETKVLFNGPSGTQSILLINSKELIPQERIDKLLDRNRNIQTKYHREYKESIGHNNINFIYAQ